MAKKSCKLILFNKSKSFSFKLLLIILILEQSLFFKEDGNKRNLVFFPSIRGSKIIFALLDKIIAVYIRLIFIQVGALALSSLFGVYYISSQLGFLILKLSWKSAKDHFWNILALKRQQK